VSSCFRVPEPIFDLVALRELVFERLKKSGAELKLNHGASRIVRCDPGQGLDVTINERTSRYDFVINCSYHNLSLFTQQLGLAPVGAELQYVLIPHFLYPQEALGLTVMDGEFCSVMPKGFNKNEFILYHVKHSVLNRGFKPGTLNSEPTQAQIDAIYANSVEFFPFLERARHFDQWHTTRAIVRNENDSRLSEIFFDPSIPNYVSILSGKISTCIQVAQAVRGLITNVGF
jgi:glycine/D-amino acid oxidase-like deaminating enzyme